MNNKIKKIQKIGFQWPMENPFIFCAHHKDAYPKGNEVQGIDSELLIGREIGNDFSGKDGFSMYHGKVVPGFPVHPHRGFETVTIVLNGFVDHFDSKGSYGRYGNGDVQWLTTGAGCQHTEMFPLINKDKENPVELFQIWLNLPSKNKFVEADYKMLWAEDIPVIEFKNEKGSKTNIRLITGKLEGRGCLEPNKNSWAADKNNNVGIYLVKMEAEASMILPAVSETLIRNLYFYQGEGKLIIEGQSFEASTRIKLSGKEEISIINGDKEAYFIVLEGEPINEPVVQYGPFVMNTKEEIYQAFRDYQETQFGGWPYDREDPVNKRTSGRFAHYADGREEKRYEESSKS